MTVQAASMSLPSDLATSAPSAPSASGALPTGDVHDFDFLAGDWTVHNRRLAARGVGSAEWDEFTGTSHVALHLAGVVNVDEIHFPTKGWSGLTLRTFHTEHRRWSIYWVSSRTGAVSPPVHGGFAGDHGEFYGEDEDDGRPVQVRFRWTKLGSHRARWEQAFSSDGVSWELNWTMDFTRVEPAI